MIAAKNRFHGHNAVKRIYARGQTTRTTGLSLKYALNQRRATYRVAVVVNKQISKSAVVRNRIRRRVYSALSGLLTTETGSYDLVFTVFDDQLATWSPAQLKNAIHACLTQAHIPAAKSTQPAGKNVKVKP